MPNDLTTTIDLPIFLPFCVPESSLSEQGELKPLSTSPEQQESASNGSNSSQLQPLMSILGGVATALILVTVVIIVTMRLRCGSRQNLGIVTNKINEMSIVTIFGHKH